MELAYFLIREKKERNVHVNTSKTNDVRCTLGVHDMWKNYDNMIMRSLLQDTRTKRDDSRLKHVDSLSKTTMMISIKTIKTATDVKCDI